MPVVSDLKVFRFPLLLIALWLVVWGGRKGRTLLVFLIAAVAVSDLFASHLVREFFARSRPCWSLDEVRLLVSCRNTYSFPSAHGANMAVCGVLISLFYPRWRGPAALAVLLVGYSRVYLGVHYPADVLAGILLGTTLGMLMYALALPVFEKNVWERGTQANRSST